MHSEIEPSILTKLCSSFLSASLIVAFVPAIPAYASENVDLTTPSSTSVALTLQAQSTNFEYTVSGSSATITKYVGSETNIVIPESIAGYKVTTIGNGAFGWSSVESVIVPDSVTTIEDDAFWYCESLTDVKLGAGITSIPEYAFANCTALESIMIPEGVTSIGKLAFRDCSSLKTVSFPTTWVSSGDDVFTGCNSLTSVSLPSGIKAVPDKAFVHSSVKSVSLPASIERIGNYAFEYCPIESVTIPSSVKEIGWYAFGWSGLKSLALPSSVETIGHGSFWYCDNLASVDLGSGLSEVTEYAFANCTALTAATIPEGVTKIGKLAFRDCASLAKIEISPSVSNIDTSSFSGCGQFVIYGYVGSYAETYAATNNINFVEIDASNDIQSSYRPSVNGWRIQNSGTGTFSEDTFYRVFSNDVYHWFLYSKEKDSAKEGMCHGYALSSALTFASMPNFGSWTYDDDFEFNAPGDVGVASLLTYPALGVDLDEYMKECFLTQFTQDAQSNSKGHKDAAKVLAASMTAASTGNPIMISINDYGISEGKRVYQGHTLVPYRVQEYGEAGYYRIYVYDCNYPSYDTTTDSRYIELRRNSSGSLDWSYNLSPSITWDSDEGEISYWDYANLTRMWGLIDAPKNRRSLSSASLLSTQAASSNTQNLLIIGGNSSTAASSDGATVSFDAGRYTGDDSSALVPIREYTMSPDTTAALYYISDEDGVISVSSGSAEEGTAITYASSGAALSTSTTGASVASIGSESCEVKLDGNQEVSFTYETASGDELIVTGSTSGKASAVVPQNDDLSLSVSGFSEVNISGNVNNENVTTLPVDVSSTEATEIAISTNGDVSIDGQPLQEGEKPGGMMSLENATIAEIADVAYTGNAQKPVPTVTFNGVTLKLSVDYKAEYKNNVNVGIASVTITGIGNYTGTKTTIFRIVSSNDSAKADISRADISNLQTKTYTGKAQTQLPTVKLNNKALQEGKDYTLSYKNNIKAGTAMIVVTGKGSYTGTKSATFMINKAKQPMSVKAKSPVVKASKVKKAKQVIAAKKAFTVSKPQGKVTYKKTSGNKKITVASNGKVTVKKGLKKGTYKVKVKVIAKGNTNYKSGSKTVTVKVKVK